MSSRAWTGTPPRATCPPSPGCRPSNSRSSWRGSSRRERLQPGPTAAAPCAPGPGRAARRAARGGTGARGLRRKLRGACPGRRAGGGRAGGRRARGGAGQLPSALRDTAAPAHRGRAQGPGPRRGGPGAVRLLLRSGARRHQGGAGEPAHGAGARAAHRPPPSQPDGARGGVPESRLRVGRRRAPLAGAQPAAARGALPAGCGATGG